MLCRQDFQFFPPKLAELQERELAVYKVCFYSFGCVMLIPRIQRLNEIPATLREPQGEDDTPEKLEAERQAAQEFIETGICHVSGRSLFSLTLKCSRGPNRGGTPGKRGAYCPGLRGLEPA